MVVVEDEVVFVEDEVVERGDGVVVIEVEDVVAAVEVPDDDDPDEATLEPLGVAPELGVGAVVGADNTETVVSGLAVGAEGEAVVVAGAGDPETDVSELAVGAEGEAVVVAGVVGAGDPVTVATVPDAAGGAGVGIEGDGVGTEGDGVGTEGDGVGTEGEGVGTEGEGVGTEGEGTGAGGVLIEGDIDAMVIPVTLVVVVGAGGVEVAPAGVTVQLARWVEIDDVVVAQTAVLGHKSSFTSAVSAPAVWTPSPQTRG